MIFPITKHLNAVEEIVLKHSNGSYETVYTNMFYADIPDINYDVYKFSSSITHLERLSLVDIDYGRPLYEKEYSPFESYIKKIEETMSISVNDLIIRKGSAILTPIGQDFLEVCFDANASAKYAAI